MTAGPGKYDDEVTWVRERTHAAGVVLIVVGGDKGAGFAVQATPEAVFDLPAALRSTADQIEADTITTAMSNFKAWLHPDD
jgi:hypothetical protein